MPTGHLFVALHYSTPLFFVMCQRKRVGTRTRILRIRTCVVPEVPFTERFNMRLINTKSPSSLGLSSSSIWSRLKMSWRRQVSIRAIPNPLYTALLVCAINTADVCSTVHVTSKPLVLWWKRSIPFQHLDSTRLLLEQYPSSRRWTPWFKHNKLCD